MLLKRKFSQLSSNKDVKVLAQNFAYLTILQIAGFILPLITLPFLASVVGLEGFGRIGFASAIIIWVQTISDWGFSYTGTRDVSRNRDNIVILSEIFSKVFWGRIMLMIISAIILYILIIFFPVFRENQIVIWATFLMIPGNIMFSEYFFQGLERMKYITFLNLLIKLLFTFCVFIFVNDEDDYILQPLFISIGFVVAGFIAMYLIIIKWKIKLLFPSYTEIWSTLKNSTDVFINNIMPNLYNSLTTVLLGFYSSQLSVGIYTSGKKFIVVSNSLLSIISRVFFPYLVRKNEKHGLYKKLSIICSLILVFILFVSAPLIVNLFYTNDFNESISVIRITSFSLFFITLNNIYGTNYLLVHNHDRLLRNIMIVSSLIGFFISFPLIIYFDYIGASLTYLLSSILIGVLPMYYANKISIASKI